MGALPSLRAEPITETGYAPFGAVLRARTASEARVANHGMALAFDDLASLENARGQAARPTLSVFHCKPLATPTLAVRLLERHPFSTQLFVPMSGRRYLLVVAKGLDEPDLRTLTAFLVEGATAITYAPGVWHHPMVALDQEMAFINLVYQDGTAADCEEKVFAEPVAEIAF